MVKAGRTVFKIVNGFIEFLLSGRMKVNVDRAFGTDVGQGVGSSGRNFFVEEGAYIGKKGIEMVCY